MVGLGYRFGTVAHCGVYNYTTELLPVFLVGAEDVLDQELVLGQPLPGDGHQFRECQSVSTTHRMQLRILTTAVCVCVCV